MKAPPYLPPRSLLLTPSYRQIFLTGFAVLTLVKRYHFCSELAVKTLNNLALVDGLLTASVIPMSLKESLVVNFNLQFHTLSAKLTWIVVLRMNC